MLSRTSLTRSMNLLTRPCFQGPSGTYASADIISNVVLASRLVDVKRSSVSTPGPIIRGKKLGPVGALGTKWSALEGQVRVNPKQAGEQIQRANGRLSLHNKVGGWGRAYLLIRRTLLRACCHVILWPGACHTRH